MNPESSVPLAQFALFTLGKINTHPSDLILGLQCFGEETAAGGDCYPIQRVSVPVLNSDEHMLREVWVANEPCAPGQFQDIIFRSNGDVLFGVIDIDESKLELKNTESSLRMAAEIAYRQIFSLLDSQGFIHVWRTWNYLPNIHVMEHDLERYRQFNVGRHQAFTVSNKPVEYSPAASALGVTNGVFSVAFIAGRTQPSRIENPRQVSAFAYPEKYGPRSPAFTRAVTVANGTSETLFISGTASIVGHETVHRGDVVAQTLETIANLAALLEEANSGTKTNLYTLNNLSYRVYIRHAKDFSQVQQVLNASAGSSIRAIYVQAEICRQDLLIEIEAFAVRPLAQEKI
jgi:chorismate lyase / 3-hydroxybenzoate synthase